MWIFLKILGSMRIRNLEGFVNKQLTYVIAQAIDEIACSARIPISFGFWIYKPKGGDGRKMLPKFRAANIPFTVSIGINGQFAGLSEDGSKNLEDVCLQTPKA
jgi:hypothetical protein